VPATPAEKPSQTPMADADVAEAPSDEAAPATGAAQVVSLDAFRKK